LHKKKKTLSIDFYKLIVLVHFASKQGNDTLEHFEVCSSVLAVRSCDLAQALKSEKEGGGRSERK